MMEHEEQRNLAARYVPGMSHRMLTKNQAEFTADWESFEQLAELGRCLSFVQLLKKLAMCFGLFPIATDGIICISISYLSGQFPI